MIALDYTVIVQILSFLLLWLVLARLLFKPFVGLLEERERRTEGVKAETSTLQSEAERLRGEYEAAIARARDEGRALREAVLQEAHETRERLLAQARESATKTLEGVREEIRREMERERAIVAGEAQAIGQQMAEKILGRRVG